jgi:hypothetical protein
MALDLMARYKKHYYALSSYCIDTPLVTDDGYESLAKFKMAPNIPPHNIGEVVDGLIALIELISQNYQMKNYSS